MRTNVQGEKAEKEEGDKKKGGGGKGRAQRACLIDGDKLSMASEYS